MHPPSPLLLHIPDAVFNGGEKDIRRAGCLKNRKITFYLRRFNNFAFYMQQRRLGKRRKRFMQALDYHIRPAVESGTRKIFPKRKVRSMGLIHNQRNAMTVGNLCDRSDI